MGNTRQSRVFHHKKEKTHLMVHHMDVLHSTRSKYSPPPFISPSDVKYFFLFSLPVTLRESESNDCFVHFHHTKCSLFCCWRKTCHLELQLLGFRWWYIIGGLLFLVLRWLLNQCLVDFIRTEADSKTRKVSEHHTTC